jgi:hypothetical protein
MSGETYLVRPMQIPELSVADVVRVIARKNGSSEEDVAKTLPARFYGAWLSERDKQRREAVR